MDFWTYLNPQEQIAKAVIVAEAAVFGLWLAALVYFLIRDLRIKRELNSFDIEGLAGQLGTKNDAWDAPLFKAASGTATQSRHFSNSAVNSHLQALITARATHSKTDISALIRITISQLTANHFWLRSIVSLFIILGLLGTLWGLAASLHQLSGLTVGGARLTDETLAQGLQILLGKLGSAFAPSIWGVIFTVAGVLLFAVYVRAASVPLISALERHTLTSWVPILSAEISEAALVQENRAAAERIGRASTEIASNVTRLVESVREMPEQVKQLTENVTLLTEKLTSDARDLNSDVTKARATLQALTAASDNLGRFAGTFKESVEKLYPFADAQELRSLYEQLLQRSDTILGENREFQGAVENQLALANDLKQQLVTSTVEFSDRVAAVSSNIVSEIGGTAAAASEAFDRLSGQNESLISNMVEKLGGPVVEKLAPIPETLSRIKGELDTINQPLGAVAQSISDTSARAVQYANDHLTKLDNKLIAQVDFLARLSGSVDELSGKFETLGAKVDRFGSEVGRFEAAATGVERSTKGMTEAAGVLSAKTDALAKALRTPQPVDGESGGGLFGSLRFWDKWGKK